MLPTHHRRQRRLVQAYLDGELDDAARRAAVEHLEACFDCSSAAETHQLVRKSLCRLATVAMPPLALLRLRRYGHDLARRG
ncbi:MAG: zf-HC2 domain-containing protein [Acidimicrobiia bacterium]